MACSVMSRSLYELQFILFLSANWMLVWTPGKVSVVIIVVVYSAC